MGPPEPKAPGPRSRANRAGKRGATAKVYLDCPIEDKDAAKGFGARWDAAEKRWYVPEGTPLENFARWLPDGVHIVKDPSELTPAKRPRPAAVEAAAAAAEKTFLNCPFAEKNEAKKLG